MKSRGLFGGKGVNLEIREREIPKLRSNEVLVKVKCCGVCGTDLNFVRDWSEGLMPLGHEISGEVIECGRDVMRVRPGDRVTVEDCTMCGECADCKGCHPELCRNMHTLGGQPGMSDYLVVNAANVNVFEGLDFMRAALTEPLAVSLAAIDTSGIRIGEKVVVLGNGAIGLMTAALAVRNGAADVVIVASPRDTLSQKKKLDVARRCGVSECFRFGADDVLARYRERVPNGADHVIVTSPPVTVGTALKLARFGGTVNVLGLNFGGQNVIPIDVNELIFQKQRIVTTFAEPAIGFTTATELIRHEIIHADWFLNPAFDFSSAKNTLQAALDGSIDGVKPYFSCLENG